MPQAVPQQIRPLTGIRGLAASYVVAYRAPVLSWIRQSEFLRHGYLAVDLFFVLSGFVMAMSYSRMFASGFSPRHYGAFLIRRLARIYPLYLLVTCTYGFAMLTNLVDREGLHPVWWPFSALCLRARGAGWPGTGPHVTGAASSMAPTCSASASSANGLPITAMPGARCSSSAPPV